MNADIMALGLTFALAMGGLLVILDEAFSRDSLDDWPTLGHDEDTGAD